MDDKEQMRERLISKIKERTKVKSYHIDYEGIIDGDIFMSKFGGLGYWDNNKEYPKDSNGNQLVLLAQINFDRDKFDNPKLPSNGLLQFYISTDDLNGMNLNNLVDQNGFRVIYHENVNYDLKREDLANIKTNLMLDDGNDEYFPFNEEFKITFTETEDYISPASWNFNEIVDNIVMEEFNIDMSRTSLYEVFGEVIMDYIYENLVTSGSKLLGHPYFTQSDPRQIEKYRDYNILLFQMDSDGPIMWGDSGVGNFFIKNDEDFGDVLWTWDCM